MGCVLALRKLKKETTSIDNPDSESESESEESAKHPGLPEDLKSLGRFKCVSKQWRSLISSPVFIKSHFSNSLTDAERFNHQLLFVGKTPLKSRLKHCSLSAALRNFSANVSDIEYSYHNLKFQSFHIVGIVNGLVCLCLGEEGLYIYNPVLKQSKHLPKFKVHGFGYDVSNDDYKVVKMIHKNESIISVYSLKSDSWMRIEGFEGWNDFGQGTYVNGKILWATRRALWSEIISEDKWKIVSLDMASCKYEVVKGPCYESSCLSCVIGSFGGSLSILCRWFECAELWVMDENGDENSWSKVFFLDYNDRVRDPRPAPYSLRRVVCILGDGEIVLKNSWGLIVYCTKTKDFRNIQLDGNMYWDFFVYVESLVSL